MTKKATAATKEKKAPAAKVEERAAAADQPASGRVVLDERTLTIVPILAIEANPYQPASRLKFPAEVIEKMAASIEEHGLILMPVVRRGRGSTYQMGDGWLRLAGYRYLYEHKKIKSFAEIPVMVRQLTDRQMADMVMEANMTRQDLTPFEVAGLYQKYLEDFKISQTELARIHGISQGQVANTIRLLELPDSVQEAIISQKITAAHGLQLLRLKNMGPLQKRVLSSAVSGGLSVAKLDEEITRQQWAESKPLVSDVSSYGERCTFSKDDCEKCEHKVSMRYPWETKERKVDRCDDPVCWGRKNEEGMAAVLKAKLAEFALAGVTQAFKASELPYSKFCYLYRTTQACSSCDKRAARVQDGRAELVCLDKTCQGKSAEASRKADEAKRRAQQAAEAAERTKVFDGLDLDDDSWQLAAIGALLGCGVVSYGGETALRNLAEAFKPELENKGKDPKAETIMAALQRPGHPDWRAVLARLSFEMFNEECTNKKEVQLILNNFAAAAPGQPMATLREDEEDEDEDGEEDLED